MPFSEYVATRNWVSPTVYCNLINLRNRFRGKAQTVRFTGEQGIYVVEDGRDTLYICRRSRHNRSKNGVLAGVERLANEYGLAAIPNLRGGLLVDCGANVGELGVWAARHCMRYISFEPEELEARCCDLSNFKGEHRTHREALWHTDTTLEFYSRPETADGSLIAGNRIVSVRRIPARRLDSMLAAADLGSAPTILKVEAEGAEPEVLQGAGALLARFDYVAVDCGRERGPERKDTFVETNTALSDAGFRPVFANFRRLTMLYRNCDRRG
jgi:FkbM family methyltransferase